MIRTITTACLVFVASIASAYDFGDFTAKVPSNWTMSEYPGIKYEVVLAPPINGFTPNIVSNSQPLLRTFKETAKTEISMLGSVIPGIKIHVG